MTVEVKYSKRFWWKACFIGIGFTILGSWLSFTLYSIGIDFIAFNPFIYLIGGFTICLSLPFFGPLFYKLKIATVLEYSAEEEKFDNHCYNKIAEHFGDKVCMGLFSGDLDQIDTTSDSYKGLLNAIESKNNNELRYCILVKLARALSKSENYDDAIKNLKDAICILPDEFIANIKIAEAYERIGAAKEAIESYASASNIPKLSADIIDYIQKQIERIKSEGPRRKPPMTGFRYMSH